MNITVLGATGMAGAAIAQEATRRGHHVTAVSRNPQETNDPHTTVTRLDLTDLEAPLQPVLNDADAVVLAVRMAPGDESRVAPLTSRVLDHAAVAGVRVLVVGGAAPLRSPHDRELLVLDDPAFVPTQWRDVASASLDQFNACTEHPNQNWIYLSPSAVFEPGQGTGSYRRGGDTLLINHDGTSRITPADLALAVLDELEQPSAVHHFTAIELAKGLA